MSENVFYLRKRKLGASLHSEISSDLPAGSFRSCVANGLILVSSEAAGWLSDYERDSSYSLMLYLL